MQNCLDREALSKPEVHSRRRARTTRQQMDGGTNMLPDDNDLVVWF
jgi:hypothetical protein